MDLGEARAKLSRGATRSFRALYAETLELPSKARELIRDAVEWAAKVVDDGARSRNVERGGRGEHLGAG